MKRGVATEQVSDLFCVDDWMPTKLGPLPDITLHRHRQLGMVRIAFDRPDVRNAFRPQTVDSLLRAFEFAHADPTVGVIMLTGNGPSSKDAGWAFSAGGDQRNRGKNGYEYRDATQSTGRLHILEVQRLIRMMPKVVMAVVPGWAVGGGHSLHVVCDLTIASKEHAKFRQTDPDVCSFDGGFGSAYLAKMVGQKRAREIFFLGHEYSAEEAHAMGMVNAVVPHQELETTAIAWGRTILQKSPTAIRMLKFAMNLVDDGLIGQQVFAGEATRLAYASKEAEEGRNAFVDKRTPDFSDVPWHY